ncbi:MAG: FAD-dependent oxidoreductase [Lyngbya sp.]|nr:FAD-dependent oxidoreductase [Lyngbya sp.]
MTHVVVIGCGVVGATIAYELSQIPQLTVTVLEQNSPAQASTGAALGVLMGAISHKTKGRAWQMRSCSIKRYETLIPELENITGRSILFNRQGILMLCFAGEDLNKWEELIATRQTQGWHLQRLDVDEIQSNYPQINCENVIGAIYSPQDRQVDPTALTLALVEAAQHNGVNFQFGVKVEAFQTVNSSETQRICPQIFTTSGELNVDGIVIAAGLGTTRLLPTENHQKSIKIRPVLGQAVQLKLSQPLGELEPVITGDDVHIVPLGNAEYWVGATVEFPSNDDDIVIDQTQINPVMEGAIRLCPALSEAKIIRQWSGLRPRPDGKPAPIIEYLSGFENILLATGHYRNGVLLAPATAETIRKMIVKKFAIASQES